MAIFADDTTMIDIARELVISTLQLRNATDKLLMWIRE